MTQRLRARINVLAVLALVCICMLGAPSTARAAEGDYQIYPTPQAISYATGEVKLEKDVTTVVESGIDAETKARLDETLKLKGMKAAANEAVPQGKGTAVLVGIKGSKGAVDAHVDKLVKEGKLSYTDGLFDKTDAYLLAALPAQGDDPSQIIVLGRDTDAAFYGLTTLYQIFQQVEGDTLRALAVDDYADVITRGFIEGYYGNPWSTEDRVNLMEWGGYYKLNAYFYAPKDDPKHNAKWRELYTEDELRDKIEPLAKAGNESKCRFVFALHPFMSNPITPANYDESVKVLKQKFTQVMDHGVRQIAILADDAGDQGKDLYIRLCREMTDWLHEQQKAENADGALKYPGLKDTLIFCPVNYMWVTVRAGTAGCPRPSRSSTPAAACGARSTTTSPPRSRGTPAWPRSCGSTGPAPITTRTPCTWAATTTSWAPTSSRARSRASSSTPCSSPSPPSRASS